MTTKENAIQLYSMWVHVLKIYWSLITNTFLDNEGNVVNSMLYCLKKLYIAHTEVQVFLTQYRFNFFHVGPYQVMAFHVFDLLL